MPSYTVGRSISGKPKSVTVEAEDALVAALRAKADAPEAVITYVRKQNVRGDKRNPHRKVEEGTRGAAHKRT